VIEMMKNKGTGAIILGCTEIPLAIEGQEYQGMSFIDPAKSLAAALISEYHKIK
jgi:aspartate/glutamate racemase